MPCGLIGMYWVKCKQSNSHTSLTTLCSHFLFCLTVIRPWLKLPTTGGYGHVICMGNLRGVFFSIKYSRRECRDPQKFIFSHINKIKVGEMVIMNDLDWPMLSYYVIKYEKFRKVMQRTEKLCLAVCFHLALNWLSTCSWHIPLYIHVVVLCVTKYIPCTFHV